MGAQRHAERRLPTACSRRSCRARPSRYRPLPSGINSVSVYTDESGEANVNFVPGLGMYFDNLRSQQEPQQRLRPGERRPDRQGRGRRRRRSIRIQPVTARPVAADPVNFTVHNLFKKTLTVFSKGVDANNITRTRSPRSSWRTRRTSTARRSRTSWCAGWPTERRGLPGLRGRPARSDGGRSRRGHHPRSVPCAAHDLPGSVGHRPPLHVHGSVGQHGRSRSSTRTRRASTSSPSSSTRASSATRSRDFSTPPAGPDRPTHQRRRPADLARADPDTAQAGRGGRSASGPVRSRRRPRRIKTIKSKQTKPSRRSCTRSGSRRS